MCRNPRLSQTCLKKILSQIIPIYLNVTWIWNRTSVTLFRTRMVCPYLFVVSKVYCISSFSDSYSIFSCNLNKHHFQIFLCLWLFSSAILNPLCYYSVMHYLCREISKDFFCFRHQHHFRTNLPCRASSS